MLLNLLMNEASAPKRVKYPVTTFLLLILIKSLF